MATIKKEKKVAPTVSSGNVFEDLGFSSEEARILLLKTDMKIAIEQEARRRNLTPRKLGKVLDIQQPQVSDLLTGKVSKMTIDKLAKYAFRLGLKVEFQAQETVEI